MIQRHAMLVVFSFTIHLSLAAQISFTDRTNLLFNANGVKSSSPLAIADMNNDGKDDVVRLHQGNLLFIEYQQGSNQPFSHATITSAPDEAWAMVVADANNDGYGDVMFGGYYDGVKVVLSNSSGGYGISYLPGNGIFVQGSNFADINNDGLLDIFACHDDGESRIWGNNGSGNFFNADNWIDMATSPPSDNSGNYGTTWTDFDNDGDLDLYIAKCRGGVTNPADPRRINALFVNDGNGNYTEAAATYGINVGWQSWAADFQDIDNDGDFDLVIANHDYQMQLFENDGTGHFNDITATAGLGAPGYYIQCLMRDFDNDGYVDIITAGIPHFYRNNGNKTFTEISYPIATANSLCVGDLNHDGFLDLYTSSNFSNVNDKLWMNNGNAKHWLAVRLQGTASNRNGVGARVKAYGAWGMQVREIRAGESYGISNSLTAFFGLGNYTQVDSVVVNWPSGQTDVLVNPSSNQYMLIEESPLCTAPDATLLVDGFACANGSTSINITLCNNGQSPLPTGIPITFYKNDPRLPSVQLLSTSLTNMAIPIGGCQAFTFPINASPSNVIFAVANDDGTAPLPYLLPNSPALECNYANNFGSKTFNYQPPLLNLGNDLSLCNQPSAMLDAGVEFHSYQWQDGSNLQNFIATTSGVFWVNALDQCGIAQSDTVGVTLTQATPVELGSDRQICASESTTLSAPGYDAVQWSPSVGLSCTDCPMPTASPSTTTTYQVTATTGACVFTDFIQVMVNMPPNLSLSATDGGCSTPAAIVATVNGNSPFTYSWSSGETANAIYPTQSGTYSLTATDINGCTSTAETTVTVTVPFSLSTTTAPVSCFGGTNGAVDLSIQGGAGVFDIVWSNGETTEDIFGLIAGNYIATVTDASGCTNTTTATVEEPDALDLQISVTPIQCNGGKGSIFTQPIGGTGAYSFAWSNGSSSQNLENVMVNNYSLTLTDALGCSAIFTQNLSEPVPISIQITVVPIPCYEGTGSILIQPISGVGPLSYHWSDGSTAQSLENVTAGDYFLTVTDANGCTKQFGRILNQPIDIQVGTTATNISCWQTNPIGEVSLYTFGGTPPLNYLWSDGSTSQNLSTNIPGSYTVTVTDANGCETSASELVYLAGDLSLDNSSGTVSCHPDNGVSDDGWIAVQALSGTAPFAWQWQGGQTDSLLSNLTAGTYLVSVTDASGCTKSTSIVLSSPTVLTLDIEGSDISCFGNMDGEASVQVSGGTPSYQFDWSNGQIDQTAQQLDAGWHVVSITDVNGCTDTTGILVSEPDLLSVGIQLGDYLLCADEVTTIATTVMGGTPPFDFLWNNGQTEALLLDVSATPGETEVYQVTTSDANGCTATAIASITGQPLFEIMLDTILAASSPTASDGSIYLETVGGIGPFSFLWSNGATSQNLENVPPGNYSLLVTDGAGCEQMHTFMVDFLNTASQKMGTAWHVTLLPNPIFGGSLGQLAIQSNLSQRIDFQLFDLTGKRLRNLQLTLAEGNSLIPMTAPEVSGVYLITLSNEHGIFTQKWVVVD
ncbi:MAG: T9SS type A sorting domain-containing protein [Bacteroidetes bacterium]|nr:T9SS type A sorting domain-containing protein [Bacteroidota bacterium]